MLTSDTARVTGLGVAEILHARALALARPVTAAVNTGEFLEVLEFRLAHEHYAVETQLVREVIPLRELTPLPCTPSFVAGLVNVRGVILTVLNIKKFFELPEAGLSDLHCIIRINGNGMEVGLLADVIVGVKSVALETLQPVLPTLNGIRGEYLKGVDCERLVVLDLQHILADTRLIVNETVSD